MTEPVVLTINMDAKCAECKKGGAAPSGLCLRCATKAMDPKRTMKSPQGTALQMKFATIFADARRGRNRSAP